MYCLLHLKKIAVSPPCLSYLSLLHTRYRSSERLNSGFSLVFCTVKISKSNLSTLSPSSCCIVEFSVFKMLITFNINITDPVSAKNPEVLIGFPVPP